MTKTAVKTELPLDERVANVLRSDDHHPSSTLATLIAEVDDAIDHADQAGHEARAAAADPKVIDHGAFGRALDAEQQAHRLRNGMAALKELEHEAQCRERLREWHAQADDVERKRDLLANELRERYPMVSSWLVDFLQRMTALDSAIETLNASAPGYESRRIVPTELAARNADGWGQSQPIGKQLKLPAFVEGSGTAPLLWPPLVQFGVGLVAGLFPNNGSPVGPARGILRFELVDGVIKKIGMDGQVIGEVLTDQPVVEPLHPEMTMREQALAEEAERTAVAVKHANDARAREVERERLNSVRHNEEVLRRQQSISR